MMTTIATPARIFPQSQSKISCDVLTKKLSGYTVIKAPHSGPMIS
ncbi:hypothetical protein [Leptospira santarosai]|nr:hypothetical protein [Leptospira santarosai]